MPPKQFIYIAKQTYSEILYFLSYDYTVRFIARFFVSMLHYCANLKAMRRYESTSLNRIVADKSHRVIVGLGPVTISLCFNLLFTRKR